MKEGSLFLLKVSAVLWRNACSFSTMLDLVETVNGSIFAPESFQKHFKSLCTNTGIVTFDKLKKLFPQ